ncbi:hypothetical protein FMUND_7400 [Fusarium mundagurra]|uniref:Uncharacterized protein n=1 Tax=Fusarium mundagurra TaxID=1567541 RepID=A0A8H5YKU9_9HYPO|nr:hypothetical protein FMUND_7400 [Fusarium mundagurra]
MEIEPEPRAAQAVTAPEARNDTAELGPPQDEPYIEQAFSIESPADAGVSWDQDPGSTSRNVRSSTCPSSLSGRLGQEERADVGARSDSSHNSIDESFQLTHVDDRILLSLIRVQVLSMLGYGADGAPIRSSQSTESRVMGFGFEVSTEEFAGLFWGSGFRINDAWPWNQDVTGVKQYIIEIDGGSTNIQTHWSPAKYFYLQRGDTQQYTAFKSMWFGWCHAAISRQQNDKRKDCIKDLMANPFSCAFSFEEPFGLLHSRWDDYSFGYSASFLTANFRGGYSIRTDHPLHDTIHWQIRYFSPMNETSYDRINCLLSKRQTATIRNGPRRVNLQERRARISFRVLKEAPEIFSILVLTDDETSPDTYHPDKGFDCRIVWKGIQLLGRDSRQPITHFLLEICRVFKFSMEAWEETLDNIDQLVLVKLDDLDDLERVEELMFDNSFNRSRDYFVALQLLRIIDEWLDEARSTVQDMFESRILRDTSIWPDNPNGVFKLAIRSMEERAAAVQSRVRDKKEEINSLRDGLFNATSLRESTKAMALNQAIYVFTVVTVLFTPVSFLAVSYPRCEPQSVSQLTDQTFWALPFLNNPTEGTDVVPVPAAFRNSFIIMPILTYVLVIGVAWFVGKRNSVNAVLGMLREFKQGTGRHPRSKWNMRREEGKKRHGRSPSP